MTGSDFIRGFGLIMIFSLLLLISLTPPARAGEGSSDATLEITEIGPITNSYGELTQNPDGTYYPGDYFHIIVEGTPNGRHGRGVPTGEWITVKTESDTKDYWYGENEKIVERGKRGFDNQSEYESFLANLKERSDVSEDSISTYPNYDYVQWRGVYKYEAPSGPSSTFKSDWFDFKADAEEWLDEEKQEYGDSVKNPHLEDRIRENYKYGVEWSDTDWRIELLELEPIVNVDYVGAWPLIPTVDQYNLEDDSKKRIVYQVDMQTYREHPEWAETNLPGTAYARVTYPAPTEGHNIPDEYAEDDIVIKKPVQIVDYEPVLRGISYEKLNWKRNETDWLIQKPYGITTRYDGDGDVEGENLTLDGRRAIVSGVSVRGSIIKPLYANGTWVRLTDEGYPNYKSENVYPPHTVVKEGKIEYVTEKHTYLALARNGDDAYYQSGSMLSPIFDAREISENYKGWGFGYVQGEEPPSTYLKVFARFGNTLDEMGEDSWERLVMDDDLTDAPYHGVTVHIEGDGTQTITEKRYFQYWVVLWTQDQAKTPKFASFRFSLSTESGSDAIYHLLSPSKTPSFMASFTRSEIPRADWESITSFYVNRRLVLYHEGDPLLNDSGVQETGTINLATGKGYSYHKGSIGLKLEPARLEELQEKRTDTIKDLVKDCGRYVFLNVNGVNLTDWETVDNDNVFRFDSGLWRYDESNQYKKWSFKFSDWRLYEGEVPQHIDWFTDSEVSFDVTLWFWQKVREDGDAWKKLRKIEDGWDYRESWKRITTKTITWSPMSTHQPVKVAAWELRDWAEQEIPENARVVLLDNAWKTDDGVSFKYTFTSIWSPENFLRQAHRAAKELEPMVENLENMSLENAIRGLSKMMEEFGGGTPTGGALGSPSEVATSVKAGLLSVSRMDNEMMSMILNDVGMGEGKPQVIEGSGSVVKDIEFRGVNYYTIEEIAQTSEMRENRVEIGALPFDASENAVFNINLSGEGMAAEVVEDSPRKATITIYAPPKSGGIRHVTLYDNENNVLIDRDYALSSFGWLPKIPGGESPLGKMLGWGIANEEGTKIVFRKWENSPRELEIRMTNEWGASTTQSIEVSRGSLGGEAGEWSSWTWFVLAIILAAIWVAFMNWLKDRRGIRSIREQYSL